MRVDGREAAPPTRPGGRDWQIGAIEALHRSGPSALGSALRLAMQVAELCGDRRIRVELPPFAAREVPGERRSHVKLSMAMEDTREVPVRGPGSERAEALLHVEEGRSEPPPRLDHLTRFARQAGLVLERHRLAREVDRVRWQAAEDRTNLAHSLRGPLNSALLRVDALLYGDPEAALGGDRVTKDLRGLRGSVLAMAERIQETLDAPDSPGRGQPSSGAPGSMGSARVPDLLLAAWTAGGRGAAGDLTLDVEAGVAPVPSGDGRLQAALAELVDLVRRSRAARVIAVTAHPSGAVRVTVRLELPEAPPPEPGAGEPERKPVPCLPEVVAELGGRTWIDAGPDGGGEVTLVLPAADVERTGSEE